jgi:nicotinamidase-related amidase
MNEIPENRLTMVFPPLPYFEIKRDSTALIIIDMQYLDAHPEYGIGAKAHAAGIPEMFSDYWPAVERAARNQRRLLDAAHTAGIDVIYTRIASRTPDARDAGPQHCYVDLAVPKGAKDGEILAEIAPTDNDIVLSKTSSSPFNSTAIDHTLRSLGVDTLLVCGVVTNGCVEGTVRDASDLGYNVVMVPDACAAVTPELHQSAITNLENGFCNCRDTDTVIREMRDA